MSVFLFSNDASSTLAGPITSSATSVTLAAGTGALFPDPGVNQQLHAVTHFNGQGLGASQAPVVLFEVDLIPR